MRAPVTHMHIAQCFIACKSHDTAQGIPDNRSAQMTNMHGLGNIRPAIIKDNVLRFIRGGNAEIFKRMKMVLQVTVCNIQINETGPGNFNRRKTLILRQDRNNLLRDLARVFLCQFGRRHRAITLELRQIRTVGYPHLS